MKNLVSVEKLYEIFMKCDMRICTDTRNIEPGSIFFALKGDNFDANGFAAKALEGGCSFAVVDDENVVTGDNYLLFDNTLIALQRLANYHRKQFHFPVIAITGSNGKTTTKELIAAVLSKKYNCLFTKGNLNNHIGVPLTLLSLKKEHEIAIIEMGANHLKEIELLCNIAEPGYGIITNIGKAHLEGFGGIEGVKKGKGELYDYLMKTKGVAFVHCDDPLLKEMAVHDEKISYGTTKLYDIVGKLCSDAGFVEFKWKTRYTAPSLATAPVIKTHLIGKYNYVNLLCAATVGNYFHVEEHKINEALSDYVPENNRSQFFDSGKNKLILDMYNANPSSMNAAIDNFSRMKEENKLLILGDMLELGTEAKDEHKAIINLIKEKKIAECVFIGPEFSQLSDNSEFRHFKTSAAALDYFKEHPVTNRIILLKGSRGIKLETLIPQF